MCDVKTRGRPSASTRGSFRSFDQHLSRGVTYAFDGRATVHAHRSSRSAGTITMVAFAPKSSTRLAAS